MSHADFLASLDRPQPPAGLSLAQEALWHAKHGDWRRAHEAAQEDEGPDSSWVHAYLHRWEGDDGNAGYWYRRAVQPFCRASLDEEWELIVRALFSD